MSSLRTTPAALMLALTCVASAHAQEARVPALPSQGEVTASATSDRVRFAAPNRVARLRLEVLSTSGEVVAEVSTRGSVLDWPLADTQGVRPLDGTYLCVVTVKEVSGRLAQRLTLLDVAGGGVTARAATASDLTPQQAEAVGPVEWGAAGVVGGSAESEGAPDAALLAHDGAQGQLVTTAGDLSFRGGDFFTGQDRELMRLSADGSLTVEGALLARGGIRFSDGTVLTTAGGPAGKGAKGSKAGVSASSAGGGTLTPSVTANRLAKFSDGSGSLADSAVTEAGGFVGIGTAAPSAPLDIVYSDDSFGFGFNLRNSSAGAQALTGYGINHATGLASVGGRVAQFVYVPPNYVDATLRDTVLFSSVGPTAALGFVSSAEGSAKPDIFLRAGGASADGLRLKGQTGFVGVGTADPQSRLDVAGDVRVSGAGSGVIFPDGTKQTTAATGGGGGGGVSGAGSAGSVPLWTATNTLSNSAISQSGNNVLVTGNLSATGNLAATYQDVAEWVPARGKPAPGTVVVLDRTRTNGVVASRRAYSTHVAGVVSAQPGVILGEGGEGKVMVATTGRVRVKVDATRLPVRVGDLLVTSGREGVAMRSVPVRAGRARLHRPGTIVGKALESLSGRVGEIFVLLSLQ